MESVLTMTSCYTTFVLTPFEENCYIVYDDERGDAMIIDPGEPSPALFEFLKEKRLAPRYILLTHGHFDHFGGAASLKRELGIPVAIHEADAPLLDPSWRGGATLFGFDVEPVTPDILLHDADVVAAGNLSVQVLHTPGHSPGGATFYDATNKRAYCGDLIFHGSVGRYDLPGSDGPTLFRSIREAILSLPDDVILLPGHGPETTVGREKRFNPFLQGGWSD